MSDLPEAPPAPATKDEGLRNSVLGIILLFIAAVVFMAAMFLAGTQAVLGVVSTILALGLLWVLWIYGIHRQRGGLFLSLSLMCFLGAFVPLMYGMILVVMKTRPATETAGAQPTPQPHPSAERPAATPRIELPLVTEALGVEPPDPSAVDVARILRDTRVIVQDKQYLMKAGQLFPIQEVLATTVNVKVKDYLVPLPKEGVEVVAHPSVASAPVTRPAPAPSPAAKPQETDFQKQTRLAQQEAVRRYPGLGMKGSSENELFVATYEQLKQVDSAFFSDPEWPLKLAEEVAHSYGWLRADQPDPITRPEPLGSRGPLSTSEPPGAREPLDKLELPPRSTEPLSLPPEN